MCGERVRKTLRDREHKCITCGLVGKRDLVSAALAAFVVMTDPDDPETATLDEPRPVRDHAGKPGPRPACSPQLTLW